MTRALLPYWLMTGQFTEGRRWHDLAVSVAPESRDHAWAVFGAGVLAVHQGDLARGGPLLSEAAALAEECLRRCAQLGEQWARGTALIARAGARWRAGDYPAAIEDALACLRIKEDLGDLHTIAMSFDLLSVCLVATSDFERTAVLHGASERLWTLLNAPALMGPAYAEIRKSGADIADRKSVV